MHAPHPKNLKLSVYSATIENKLEPALRIQDVTHEKVLRLVRMLAHVEIQQIVTADIQYDVI